MAMDFVLAFAALIDEGELKQGANVGALAGESDKDGDIRGIIFGILTVRIKVNGPLVTADGEILAGDVFTNSDAFGQGVTLDCESVRAIYGFGYGEGGGWIAWRRRGRRGHGRREFGEGKFFGEDFY